MKSDSEKGNDSHGGPAAVCALCGHSEDRDEECGKLDSVIIHDFLSETDTTHSLCCQCLWGVVLHCHHYHRDITADVIGCNGRDDDNELRDAYDAFTEWWCGWQDGRFSDKTGTELAEIMLNASLLPEVHFGTLRK